MVLDYNPIDVTRLALHCIRNMAYPELCSTPRLRCSLTGSGSPLSYIRNCVLRPDIDTTLPIASVLCEWYSIYFQDAKMKKFMADPPLSNPKPAKVSTQFIN